MALGTVNKCRKKPKKGKKNMAPLSGASFMDKHVHVQNEFYLRNALLNNVNFEKMGIFYGISLMFVPPTSRPGSTPVVLSLRGNSDPQIVPLRSGLFIRYKY